MKGCPGATHIWNIEHKSTEETTDQKWHVEQGTISSSKIMQPWKSEETTKEEDLEEAARD